MEDIFKSIIPIIIERNNKPEQIASGVLIEISNELFILTAAHVHDDIKDKSILIPTKNDLIPFIGNVSYLPVPDNQREKDKIDISYYKFSKEWNYEFHDSISPISYSEIDFTDVQIENDFYTFSGYPHRKSKYNNNILNSELFSYTGTLASDIEYKENDYSKMYNILISFNRNKSVKFNGDKYKPPLPEGISGGGIFSYPKQKSKIFQRNKAIRLVGIGHTYHPKSNYFAGTSINVYFMCIIKNNPHLCPRIQASQNFIPMFIGFAYYNKDEWHEIRNIMEDKDSMSESYEEWRLTLENYLDRLTSEGKQFFRITLELQEMLVYAKVNKLPLNGKLRTKLTSEKLGRMIFENAIVE